jgi:hypothetical protein
MIVGIWLTDFLPRKIQVGVGLLQPDNTGTV